MKILFAGESWVVSTTHIKGVDFFTSNSYDESTVQNVRSICEAAGIEFVHMPSHLAVKDFPGLEGLKEYDAVILSDIGSDCFYYHPESLAQSRIRENRLISLCTYVQNGGGLAMFGGWNSFTGMACKARYKTSPIAAVLPVEMLDYDDRVEKPEGAVFSFVKPEHPILSGVDLNWHPVLGYNQLKPKAGADTLAVCGDDVILAVQNVGKGRTAAYASDIATHWAPDELTKSTYYKRFVENFVKWLCGEQG